MSVTEYEATVPSQGPEPLLEVSHVTMEFSVRSRRARGVRVRAAVKAVSDVSFTLRQGETLGIVGETGCGKSTLARAVLQAPPPVSGSVVFDGEDLTKLRGRSLQHARRSIQLIFQDPYSSLDPRWKVRALVEEPLAVQGVSDPDERATQARRTLELVGLDPARFGDRRPGELSGGQCQRVAIARALVLSPQLLVCDEVVSSLDVSVQAQILNLFEDLRSELSLSCLFIAHDLAVVKHVSDRVAVMYLGRFCEVGPASTVYESPAHPYTAALLSSIPRSGGSEATGATEVGPQAGRRRRAHLGGEPPSPIDPPSGCRFRTRCPRAEERCAIETPELHSLGGGHEVACHFPLSAPIGAPAERPTADLPNPTTRS
jgi:oligopeptide/dipeptide ABC transporter ATP-binding protein